MSARQMTPLVPTKLSAADRSLPFGSRFQSEAPRKRILACSPPTLICLCSALPYAKGLFHESLSSPFSIVFPPPRAPMSASTTTAPASAIGPTRDGDVEKLYEFDGQYAYGDREVWRIVANTLKEMRARGERKLSVLDLGCGPGTWIRRVVGRALQLGFTQIRARGVDLAKAQVRRSRLLSHDLAGHAGVSLRFEAGDIRRPMPEADRSVDICLCLYGVLNHLPPDDLPAVFGKSPGLQRASSSPQLERSAARPRSTSMA